MPTAASGTKRYNLVLPMELYDQLQEVADQRHTTIQELVRKFLKLGLIAVSLDDTPGSELIIREDGVERRILMI